MKIQLPYQKIFIGIFFCLSVLSFPIITNALTPQEVPNPQEVYQGWVTDMANILTQESEQRLNQQIGDLEAKNGTEIAIVTVPTTQPSATPKEFTTELFNHWGIGKQGVDNGILFLVSTGDRRVEIETGYGMEGILPDARVGNIIDNHIIPNFREGNFEKGILNGTTALIEAINLSAEFENIDTNSNLYFISYQLPFVTILLVAGSGFFLKKEVKKLKKPVYVNTGEIARIPIHKKYPNSSLCNILNFILIVGLCLLLNFLVVNWLFQSEIHINLYQSLNLKTSGGLNIVENTPQSLLVFSFQILAILWCFLSFIFLGHFSTLLKEKSGNIKIINLIIFMIFIPFFLFINIFFYLIFVNNNLSIQSINVMVYFWIYLSSIVIVIPSIKLAYLILFNPSYLQKSFLILTGFLISLIINWLLFNFVINNSPQIFLLFFISLSLIYFIISEFVLIEQEERIIRFKALKKLTFLVSIFFLTCTVIFSLASILIVKLINSEQIFISTISKILSFLTSIGNYILVSLLNNTQLATIINEGNNYNFILIFLMIIMSIFSINIPFYFLKKRFYTAETNKPRFYDEKSKEPMKSVPSNILNTLLREPELVAQKIGSLEFEGWIPSSNNNKTYKREDLHIRGYINNRSRKFEFCPHCQEFTMIKTSQTTLKATTTRTGIELITSRCQCCDHVEETEKIIPMVVVSSSSSGGGYSGGSSSGGGGSFGGGSSGGGGAGGSW